jgi:putative DNA primase/helicase
LEEVYTENRQGSSRRESSGTPTHPELRDRWISANPETPYAFGLGEWRRYRDGIWHTVTETQIEKQLATVIEAATPEGIRPTSSVLASVTKLTQVKLAVPDELWDSNPDILVCENGTLHIPTGELRKHSAEDYQTSGVPYNYKPNAKAAFWTKFLEDLESGTGITDFLQEFAGLSLTTDTTHEIAVWLYGPRGSGKSTFIEGLRTMLGPRAGLLGLAEVEKTRFGLGDLAGKSLMVSSEQPAQFITVSHILNRIISGEPIRVEEKYRPAYEITPYAKLCWGMNELPRVSDAADGLFRRVKVVKFPQIPEEKRDPHFRGAIRSEGAGILNWGLEGLARLRERGRFEIPESIRDASAEFETSNDIPAMFVAEACARGPAERTTGQKLYEAYRTWCEESGHRAQSKTRVAEDWARLGLQKIKPKGIVTYLGVRPKLPGELRDDSNPC